MILLYKVVIGAFCNTVEKVWGEEYWLVNNEKYCAKVLDLKKQHQCSMHYHKEKKETFFILKGKIILSCCDGMQVYYPGCSVTIEPKQYHSFIGLEDSYILEISTQHKEEDSYRQTSSKKLDKLEFDEIKSSL